jgi:hypothetical protein
VQFVARRFYKALRVKIIHSRGPYTIFCPHYIQVVQKLVDSLIVWSTPGLFYCIIVFVSQGQKLHVCDHEYGLLYESQTSCKYDFCEIKVKALILIIGIRDFFVLATLKHLKCKINIALVS